MSLLHPRAASLVPALAVPARPAPERQSIAVQRRLPDAPEAAFAVERLEALDAVAHRDAWADLVARALEPNVFLDPDFALPAAQHLAARRRPCFVLVWAAAGDGPRDLVAVCPVVGRRGPLRGLASAWIHDLSTLGSPLLDRDRAVPALGALLAWAGERLRGAPGLLVPALPAAGPTAAALRDAAAAGGLDLVVLGTWERAVMHRVPAGPSASRSVAGGEAATGEALASVDVHRGAGLAALSPKGAKELRRQHRRLSERGTLVFASAGSDDAVRGEVERFLALEAAGWKGAAGTALLSWPERTAFARTATRLLVRRGLCRIDSLTLDGAPVAMAVILTAGPVDFLWKIAYREDLARFSPGVQLVLEITDAQRRSGRAAMTDSCAVPGHPMIDRVWRDRIRLCDVAVAIGPGRAAGFRRAVAVERATRRLRAEAKRLVLAWRARRMSGRR